MPACLPQEHPDWGAHVRALLAAGHTPPRGGVDAGDHPPITPMRAASGAELSGDAWRLYNMVARNFIGSLCASPRRRGTLRRGASNPRPGTGEAPPPRPNVWVVPAGRGALHVWATCARWRSYRRLCGGRGQVDRAGAARMLAAPDCRYELTSATYAPQTLHRDLAPEPRAYARLHSIDTHIVSDAHK